MIAWANVPSFRGLKSAFMGVPSAASGPGRPVPIGAQTFRTARPQPAVAMPGPGWEEGFSLLVV